MSGIPLLPGVWLLLVSLVVMVTAGGGRQHGLGTSLELQCPPCDRIHCTPRRAKRLACRGGVTRGICNCCPVCAKVAGEACGGAWDYLGKCDRGLTCIARGPAPELLQQVTSRSNLATKSQGICKTEPFPEMSYQPVASYCKPKCTFEYCTKNKKAVCSAIDNAEEKQDCQGDCQHTSCSGCRFVRDEPDCVKCAKDDFKCMKKFGRCVKTEVCNRQIYPCKLSEEEEDAGLKFKCFVPQCMTL